MLNLITIEASNNCRAVICTQCSMVRKVTRRLSAIRLVGLKARQFNPTIASQSAMVQVDLLVPPKRQVIRRYFATQVGVQLDRHPVCGVRFSWPIRYHLCGNRSRTLRLNPCVLSSMLTVPTIPRLAGIVCCCQCSSFSFNCNESNESLSNPPFSDGTRSSIQLNISAK